MDVLHDVGPNDCVKISFHEVKYKIDIFIILGLEDAEEGYDVGVPVELLQEDHLLLCN